MTNKQFYNEMFSNMETYLSRSIGQMMAMAGVSLTEVDPEYLKFWNDAVKYLNDSKRLTLAWAESQDRLIEDQQENNRKNKIMMQTMCGMIEKQRITINEMSDILRKVERKLDKKD